MRRFDWKRWAGYLIALSLVLTILYAAQLPT
jgi:hypothetical protein